MSISLTEALVLALVLIATVLWVVTLALVALNRGLTSGQRIGWLAVIALTHVLGAVAFLAWDRLRMGGPSRVPSER
jgi:hypothetical protein